MTTPRQCRCKDCSYLVVGVDGCWCCDDANRNVEDIPDDECSLNQVW